MLLILNTPNLMTDPLLLPGWPHTPICNTIYETTKHVLVPPYQVAPIQYLDNV